MLREIGRDARRTTGLRDQTRRREKGLLSVLSEKSVIQFFPLTRLRQTKAKAGRPRMGTDQESKKGWVWAAEGCRFEWARWFLTSNSGPMRTARMS